MKAPGIISLLIFHCNQLLIRKKNIFVAATLNVKGFFPIMKFFFSKNTGQLFFHEECIYDPSMHGYKVTGGIKKQVAQRATIAHPSPMCQGQSALKHYTTSPFPHPNDATHKIWSRLANWLQRYSSLKVWNFSHSRASNSKMNGLIRPKIELDQAFIPVLVTSNFDDDSNKNEHASM